MEGVAPCSNPARANMIWPSVGRAQGSTHNCCQIQFVECGGGYYEGSAPFSGRLANNNSLNRSALGLWHHLQLYTWTWLCQTWEIPKSCINSWKQHDGMQTCVNLWSRFEPPWQNQNYNVCMSAVLLMCFCSGVGACYKYEDCTFHNFYDFQMFSNIGLQQV